MKNSKKTLLIEERNIVVALKEDHILMYDIEPVTKDIKFETEGILNKVNAELYEKISLYFGVDLKKYGVEKYDETFELSGLDIQHIEIIMDNSRSREVQSQENYNRLSAIKTSDKQNFLVESQLGIGTIYNLQLVFNSANDIFFSYSIGASFHVPDNALKDTIIIDISGSFNDTDIEDLFKEFEKLGFKKIIIVATHS